MPRYLRNRKTGVIIPWNEYRVSHPDLYEWEGDPLNPDPDPVAKAINTPRKTVKKRAARKKAPEQLELPLEADMSEKELVDTLLGK